MGLPVFIIAHVVDRAGSQSFTVDFNPFAIPNYFFLTGSRFLLVIHLFQPPVLFAN